MKKLILISALLFSFNGWAITDYKPYDETAIAGEEITEDIVKKVNKIVHLAAYADVRASMEDPNKWYENNVVKSSRLFELCNKFNTQCVYASSSCVKEWWKSPYGTSKKVMEDMANVHGRFVGLRFSNVYGDNDNFDKVNGHVIPALPGGSFD